MPGAIGMTEACKNTEVGQKALTFLASAEAQQIYATAQPGIYLNKQVDCELSDAYQTLYEAMKNGESMEVWQNGNLYSYGDYHIHVQDYLAGGITLEEVIQLLDSDTAKNASAASDSNWN
jgi:raffinose/stachyose/melibiose transport system substrate-binding protein